MDESHGRDEKRKAYTAPVLAILSAIGSLACCLPFAFLAAFGAASAAAMFAALRPWLLALSAVLLVMGFVQLYRGGATCRRRSALSVTVVWIVMGIFLAMLFFRSRPRACWRAISHCDGLKAI